MMAHPLEALWSRLAGPADQGPVDFAHLTRRTVPNDSLAASPGATTAKVDVTLPVYADGPDTVMRRLDAMLADDASAERVDDRTSSTYRRYVVRTRRLRFPDTVDVKATPAPDGGTLLLAYSRSLLGKGDFGSNRKRLARWAGGLARMAR
ncbi:DUF1499 domain-containing protein [Aurantimonas sp. A2-1-M11]|uniref:DUF1499 domain-containing protein n=1 Tax=Aurantimonas sp. A2-1-M11 TaxID=3113712 RepID=UPI002F925120